MAGTNIQCSAQHLPSRRNDTGRECPKVKLLLPGIKKRGKMRGSEEALVKGPIWRIFSDNFSGHSGAVPIGRRLA